MRVTDQDTGKPYNLDVTKELKADLDAYDQSDCKHPRTEIRERKNRGGALHLYEQCVTCGASGSLATKRPSDLKSPPAWNEGHEDQYKNARKAERDAILQKHIRKQKSGEEGFRREYDIYLTTPEWRVKRAKVLKRANGLCEGCLEREATQVHHLSYRHIFQEFMFELIAVCQECHARLHADKNGDLPADGDNDLEWEFREGHPCDGCRWGSEESGQRWCSILNEYAAVALSPGGDCGPEHVRLEPLK